MITPGPGIFTLSLDLELAWGSWQRTRVPAEAFVGGAHFARKLDALAQELSMAFTFAIVGAVKGLSLTEIEGLETITPVNVVRPELGPFQERLPTVGQIRDAPERWLAPDVVDDLISSPAGHDIGSHTYFHSVPATREGFIADVRACRTSFGTATGVRSLVFPRNAMRHEDALGDADILVYRGKTLGASGHIGGSLSVAARVWHTAEQVFGRRAGLATIERESPALLTSSAILTLRTGLRRRIPMAVLRRRFVRPLQDAARSGGIYHLWSHPWNLALPDSDAFELLGEVCSAAAALRNRGDMEILTMTQLSDRRRRK